jgi:hypothetical protein
MTAIAILLGIGLYVERSYEGDEIAQESVPILGLMLGCAAWLMERRLRRPSIGLALHKEINSEACQETEENASCAKLSGVEGRGSLDKRERRVKTSRL